MTASIMPYIKPSDNSDFPFQRVLSVDFAPQREFVYTRTDGQPDSETITFESGTQWKRTYTYDSSGFVTKISQWIKQ